MNKTKLIQLLYKLNQLKHPIQLNQTKAIDLLSKVHQSKVVDLLELNWGSWFHQIDYGSYSKSVKLTQLIQI